MTRQSAVAVAVQKGRMQAECTAVAKDAALRVGREAQLVREGQARAPARSLAMKLLAVG